MKNSSAMIVIAGLAAVSGVAWYLLRRAPSAARPSEAQNQSLARPFDFGPSERYDLSGTGQGSGFFTRQFQLSAMP